MFTTEMLIKAVSQSFIDFDSKKISSIFLTLQQVMECVLIRKGGNDYKLLHMAMGKLPKFWICANKTYDEAAQVDFTFLI